jgi:hypothetical protein
VDRIELSTSPLPRECSTTELHEPGGVIPLQGVSSRHQAFNFHPLEDDGGAGDETRTRDIQLGKLTLYQLSYSRRSLLREVSSRSRERDDTSRSGLLWWAGMDLNHRRLSQRIYSPSPLTTRAPTHERYHLSMMPRTSNLGYHPFTARYP